MRNLHALLGVQQGFRHELATNCNELGGGDRRRLYSDATGVGRSGSHKEQQTHSGDGIC